MNLTQLLNVMYGAGAIAVMIMVFLSFMRAVLGPTAADRVVAINIIGTKIMVIVALISHFYRQEFYLDIAVVYALMSFITTIGVAKYMEKGALK